MYTISSVYKKGGDSFMKFFKTLSASVLILSLAVAPLSAFASDNKNPVDELWGSPTFVYGSALSVNQKETTKQLLGLDESVAFEEVKVTGEDMVRLLGRGNPKSAMFSSALIEHNQSKEGGILVEVVTPQNITSVSQNQYSNALITAGAEDVQVKIASPVAVTGHSALTGIYKAYESAGAELDQDRMIVAQDELKVTTEIVEANKGEEKFNAELLNTTMVSIKEEVAKQINKGKEITQDAAVDIINEEIKRNGLDQFITEEHVDKLVQFAIDYAKTDAAISDVVLDQLDALKEDALGKAKAFAESIGESIDTEGFVDSVKSFFNKIFSFFGGLFSSDKSEEVVDSTTNIEEDVNEVKPTETVEPIVEDAEEPFIEDVNTDIIEEEQPSIDDVIIEDISEETPVEDNPSEEVINENPSEDTTE